MGEQLGLAFSTLWELALERFGNTSVQRPSRLTQQRAVGRVLYKCVFEQISRVRGRTLLEQQASRNETVKRRVEVRLRLARHRSKKRMRELSADSRSDLCHLLGGAKPIEPRHQRRM